MSETVKNLINAIAAGNAVETEQAFGQAMAEKLAGKLDDMRMNIAQGMFNHQEQAQQSTETTAEE
jgi:thymidine phosphorylase